jgi:hypothetical protein
MIGVIKTHGNIATSTVFSTKFALTWRYIRLYITNDFVTPSETSDDPHAKPWPERSGNFDRNEPWLDESVQAVKGYA